MQFSLRMEYPNGASHLINVEKPGRSNHVFWGPQVTRASQVVLEGDGPWVMEEIPTGVIVRYDSADADHWQIGHNFANLGTRQWMYSIEKYRAFWDGVWPGILEEA